MRCLRFALLFLGLSYLLSCSGKAQPVELAGTLPDERLSGLAPLLDKALAQSPRMLSRNIALLRAEGDALAGFSRLLPSLNASGRYAYDQVAISGTRSTDGFGAFYNVGLSQPLFHWGDRSADRQIGLLYKRIAERSYAEAYRDLATMVRSQYLRLVVLKHGLLYRQSLEANARRQLAEARSRMETGTGSTSHLGMAEIALDEASLNVEVERVEFENSKRSLARLCGMDGSAELSIPDALPVPAFEDDQAIQLLRWAEQSGRLESTPSMESARDLLRQSQLRYAQASHRLLPRFDFNASTGVENQAYISAEGVDQSATRRYQVGVSANWTLFDGFATRAAKRQALAEKRDATLRVQELGSRLADDSRHLVERFGLALRRLKLAETKLRISQGGLAATEQDHKLGHVASETVDERRRDVVANELSAYLARAEVYERWSELLGLLWLDPALSRLPSSYLHDGR